MGQDASLGSHGVHSGRSIQGEAQRCMSLLGLAHLASSDLFVDVKLTNMYHTPSTSA